MSAPIGAREAVAGARAAARLRLDVAYDGTDFSGWAAQPDRRTVAGELLTALDLLFRPATGVGQGRAVGGPAGVGGEADARRPAAGAGAVSGLTVAGRTDAGVHATGQVCHVDVPAEPWRRLAPSLLRRLAAVLPPDVRVTAAHEVPATFDARFSALWRRYDYRVADAAYGADPLRRHDTLAWPRPLDLDALNAASRGLCGTRDFAAYCRRKEHGTTLRAVTRLDWRRADDGVLVGTVQADAFCQAMVRSLVGALLAVGDGRRPVHWPASLLDRRERASEVTVAPAYGLTLVAVGYPDDPEQYARRAEATRRRRDSDAGGGPGPDALATRRRRDSDAGVGVGPDAVAGPTAAAAPAAGGLRSGPTGSARR
jgi:tRNA pseudouridine38-40 synthase